VYLGPERGEEEEEEEEEEESLATFLEIGRARMLAIGEKRVWVDRRTREVEEEEEEVVAVAVAAEAEAEASSTENTRRMFPPPVIKRGLEEPDEMKHEVVHAVVGITGTTAAWTVGSRLIPNVRYQKAKINKMKNP